MRFQTKNNGFSMTELSMVIVIISLIVAASFKGVSMIKHSKARAVIGEANKIKVSLNSFYSKYEQYPGDFDDATTYWGSSNTSNGNGDGKVKFLDNSIYESYRAWQHLTFARMIDGKFVGSETTGTPALGTDIPESKGNGGLQIDYGVFNYTKNNVLIYGAPTTNTDTPTLMDPIITPEMAFNIDSKIDDGKPLSGSVKGDDDGDSSANTGCISNSLYDITTESKTCVLGFKLPNQN